MFFPPHAPPIKKPKGEGGRFLGYFLILLVTLKKRDPRKLSQFCDFEKAQTSHASATPQHADLALASFVLFPPLH